jgi:hypothetical protein
MSEILGTSLRTASRLAKRLVLALGSGAGYAVTTLSADGTIGEYSPPVLFVAPDASRNLDFLADVEVAGSCFIVGNTDATNTVTLRSSAASTVLALKPKEFGIFVYNGTAWKFMQAQVGTLSASLLASANTWAGLQTFGAGIAAKGPVTFKDATDATRLLSFVLSGIGTGTTRTLTMPDANVDLADVATNTANIAKFGSADALVRSTIAVADAPGGLTTAALTLACTRPDGTAIATARQMYIVDSLTQYRGNPSGSATYGTATVGSIVASGTGWALIQTSTTGAFACTVTNAADETLYFSTETALGGVSDPTKYAVVVGSNSDSATWSA